MNMGCARACLRVVCRGHAETRERMDIASFLAIISLVACMFLNSTAANVLVVNNNSSLTFVSTEANFAPRVHGAGIRGVLLNGNPYDACSTLTTEKNFSSTFLLTIRGNCSFDIKVRVAQDAGLAAVIIFDSEYSDDLVTMAGSSDGIEIPAVFVSRLSGERLSKYVDDVDAEIWILPTSENTLWSIFVFSIIAIIAGAAAFATWLFLKRERNRRSGRQYFGSHVPCVMNPRVVKAMTTITYKCNGNLKAAQEACTICLEDYIPGEKLRVLPCCHRFHETCIDAWLTMWQAFCPICKRDARFENAEYPVCERTPLLRPRFQSGSDIMQSSPESSPIQIPPSAPSDFLCVGSGGASCSSSHQVMSESRFFFSFISNSPNISRFSTVQSSLEAFRASPYFTPPSSCHNLSPFLSDTYAGPCLLDESSTAASLSSLSVSSQSKSYLNPSKKSYSTSKLSLDV